MCMCGWVWYLCGCVGVCVWCGCVVGTYVGGGCVWVFVVGVEGVWKVCGSSLYVDEWVCLGGCVCVGCVSVCVWDCLFVCVWCVCGRCMGVCLLLVCMYGWRVYGRVGGACGWVSGCVCGCVGVWVESDCVRGV